jgi:small subunit ribosomal protein S13
MLVRIAGIVLPQKRLEIALTYLYGIGKPLANVILRETGIDRNRRPADLSEMEVNALREAIEHRHRVEGELRREVLGNIKRLKEIGCYRGSRHVKRLPTRGQRTKTNSRTVRGNVRKTMGSGRRPAAEKT